MTLIAHAALAWQRPAACSGPILLLYGTSSPESEQRKCASTSLRTRRRGSIRGAKVEIRFELPPIRPQLAGEPGNFSKFTYMPSDRAPLFSRHSPWCQGGRRRMWSALSRCRVCNWLWNNFTFKFGDCGWHCWDFEIWLPDEARPIYRDNSRPTLRKGVFGVVIPPASSCCCGFLVDYGLSRPKRRMQGM